MKQEIVDELNAFIEKTKGSTKSYLYVAVEHEGFCHVLSNGTPMDLCFMKKVTDMLVDKLMVEQARNPVVRSYEKPTLVPLAAVESPPVPAELDPTDAS